MIARDCNFKCRFEVQIPNAGPLTHTDASLSSS
jgi:hypothetical protein